MKFKNKIIITLVACLTATTLAITNNNNVGASTTSLPEYNNADIYLDDADIGTTNLVAGGMFILMPLDLYGASVDDYRYKENPNLYIDSRWTYNNHYNTKFTLTRGALTTLDEIEYRMGSGNSANNGVNRGDNYMVVQNIGTTTEIFDMTDTYQGVYCIYLFTYNSAPVINTSQETFFYNINNAPTLEQIKANFTATDVEDGNITNRLVFESNYNQQVVGNYTIKASVSDNYGNPKSVTNNIYLVDGDDPIITGQANHTYEVGKFTKEQILFMVKATINISDNYNSLEELVITYNDNIAVNVVGNYTLTTKVLDTSGNDSTYVQTIDIVDVDVPIISGDEVITIPFGSTITVEQIKAKYSVTDNYDKTISNSNIIVSGIFDLLKTGNYPLTLTVKDINNNVGTKPITLRVYDDTKPTIIPSFEGNVRGTYIPTKEQLKALFTFSDNYSSKGNLTIDFSKWCDIESKVWGQYLFEISCKDENNNLQLFQFTYDYFDGNAPVIYVSGTVRVDSSITLNHAQLLEIMKNLGLLEKYENVKEVLFQSPYLQTPSKVGSYKMSARILFNDDTEEVVENFDIKVENVSKDDTSSKIKITPMQIAISCLAGVALIGICVFVVKKVKKD